MSFLRKWIVGEPAASVEVAVKEKSKVAEILSQQVMEKSVAVCKPKPVLPPPPVPVSLSSDNLVKPFCVRSIDHSVTLDGNTYNVYISDFSWLTCGTSTHAKVAITSPGRWSVSSRGQLMLTFCGRANDDTDDMIGAFAQAGLMVNRRLLGACLYPIQNQILEIERQLKSFL